MGKVGRPKQYGETRDTANDLKKSALDLMARKGFSAVSIKDIADEAGLTPAMIYYHFRGKDGLLCASIEFAIDEALSRFSDVSKDIAHPAALIHEWLGMHVSMHSHISKVLQLILEYNRSNAQVERVDQAISHFYASERDLLMRCVKDGVEQGHFQTDNPEAIRRLISTFLDGAVLRTQIRGDYDIQNSIEEFEQILWSALKFDGKPD